MSRKLLLIILIPAVLLLGGYLFLRYSLQSGIDKDKNKSGNLPSIDTLGGKKVSDLDLRPLFINRMQQLLKKSSNGLYNLTVGDMQLDVLASTLVFKNVKMEPDSVTLDSLKKNGMVPGDVYTVSFEQLQIEGINIDDAITSKTMDYKLVKLIKPVIVIHHKKDDQKNDTTVKEDFSQRFLKEMEKLSIKKLVIEEGDVTVYNDAKKGPPNKLKHVSVVMDDLLLDSTTRKDKDRFLFAEKAAVSFKDFNKPTPDGLYNLKIGEVKIEAPRQQVRLTDFSFTSPLSKAEFVKRQKQSKELYNLTLPSVTISGVDWWTLLNEEEILADEIKAQGGKLSIYLDRSLPPKSKMGNFPNQMTMKMPMKMNISKLNISNLDFSYGEYNPISEQSGTVYIDDVGLDVTNLSNIKRKNAKPMIINGKALLMHKVPVQADFVFDMVNHSSGKFSARIKADGFDGAILNDFIMPMGLMKIEKGTLQGMEANITGDQWKASGDVLVLYKDLKLHLLEKDKGEKALDKKGFTTFVANLFVLKNSNPKGDKPPRKEQASFMRIQEGGFFMLVWKTMLVGILKTIGAPEKLAYKTMATANKN